MLDVRQIGAPDFEIDLPFAESIAVPQVKIKLVLTSTSLGGILLRIQPQCMRLRRINVDAQLQLSGA